VHSFTTDHVHRVSFLFSFSQRTLMKSRLVLSTTLSKKSHSICETHLWIIDEALCMLTAQRNWTALHVLNSETPWGYSKYFRDFTAEDFIREGFLLCRFPYRIFIAYKRLKFITFSLETRKNRYALAFGANIVCLAYAWHRTQWLSRIVISQREALMLEIILLL
jgi:hypothetical protein